MLQGVIRAPNSDRSAWEKQVGKACEALPKRHHIRKTDPGIVARNSSAGPESEPQPAVMRWGFHRAFNPSVNNARDDKLDSDLWRRAFAERRCAIPVAAFYEWTGPRGHKQTHAFRRADGRWLWAAGIWEESREHGPCYSLVTTEAAPWMEAFHHRMPALLDAGKVVEYLESADPRSLIAPRAEALEHFSCENPLKMSEPQPPVPRNQKELWD
ncbi:MAG: SOS response-associated peptidase family protein [Verrucomicrobiales bacterium]